MHSVRNKLKIPRYYDVGVNITDAMFSGIYHGRQHHRNDTIDVLKKAYKHHVKNILLTGSSLEESRKTMEIIQSLQNLEGIPILKSTIGVHPCTVMEFEENGQDPSKHLENLKQLLEYGIELDLVRAFGEIGLDYDRLHYTPMDKQLLYFEKQLHLATNFNLPLFLHMRNSIDDFIKTLYPFLSNKLLPNENLLVHSFTGNKEELEKLLNLEARTGYRIFISINGAGLRDLSTLDIINKIPLDRLMIETDSPWCEVKKTHPSYKYLQKSPNMFYPDDDENYELVTEKPEIKDLLTKFSQNKKNPKGSNITLFEFLPIPIVKSDKFDNFKYTHLFVDSPLIKSRNEPCLIGLVAQVICQLRDESPEDIIDACYNNSMLVFT